MMILYIGEETLESLTMDTLQVFINGRRKEGKATRTINHGLAVVRRILNLATYEWFDENGMTWLATRPNIKLLPEPDLRKPHPLTWQEQNLS